jgi:hypothetical protein
VVTGTRRALLAAAGGAALAGCGRSTATSRPKQGTPVARADVDLLNRLIDLEDHAVAAYAAAAPLLDPGPARAAKRFLQQELDHADGLARLVRDAGGKPRKPRASYDLGHPRTGEDILRVLHRIESAQLAAYLDAIPRLSPGPVRAMAAAFFANDAQHVSIVRAQLGLAPVPAALVTGRE